MSPHTWADLFERAAAHEVGVAEIRDALAARRRDRSDDRDDRSGRGDDEGPSDAPVSFDRAIRAARVVADADVLAADLLADGEAGEPASPPDSGRSVADSGQPATEPGRSMADSDRSAADSENPARDAMDLVRAHSWLRLVASEPLLDDAEAVIADLAAPDLAADWRATVAPLATLVTQPPEDHPALASALHGDAAHVLSFDESLRGARAGLALRQRVETSVRDPAAFVAVFDAAGLYRAIEGGRYPGPDRDPRDRPTQ